MAKKKNAGGKAASAEAKTRIKPLRDRVVVRRKRVTDQKVGSIIVPDSAKEKPQEAEVVAVGPGRLSDEGEVLSVDLKAGDRVLIGKWSGTEVTIDDEEYLILKEDEVLCLLDQ